MIDLETLFIFSTLLGVLVFWFKFVRRLGDVATTLGMWVAYSLFALVLCWGIYNAFGAYLRLWEPMSLDRWIAYVAEKLGLRGILDKLNDAFGGWLFGW